MSQDSFFRNPVDSFQHSQARLGFTGSLSVIYMGFIWQRESPCLRDLVRQAIYRKSILEEVHQKLFMDYCVYC